LEEAIAKDKEDFSSVRFSRAGSFAKAMKSKVSMVKKSVASEY